MDQIDKGTWIFQCCLSAMKLGFCKEDAEKISRQVCSTCGSPMMIRCGKESIFLSCSSFATTGCKFCRKLKLRITLMEIG